MKSLRTVCLIALAAAQICLSASCGRTARKPVDTPPDDTRPSVSSVPVSKPQTTVHNSFIPPQTARPTLPQTTGPDWQQTTETYLPPDVKPPYLPEGIPIFRASVLDAYPKTLSAQERQALTDELETLLAGKSYSETAKNLVRDTAAGILDGQAEFQSLFGFLKPHDTKTYFRKYFLNPLDSMVDTLRCCGEECPDDLRWLHETYGENPGFSGITDELDKSIAVVMSEPGINTVVLTHEVYHAATLQQHFKDTTAFYYELMEGSATVYQLALLGSAYTNLIQLISGSTYYPNPDDPDCALYFNGLNGMNYSGWSNKYFKLLALTDFDTMDLFLLPEGELEIRKNLAKRYGKEGERYYDQLQSQKTFSEAVENEARFLRLFISRMQEIDSPEKCVSYLQLYRLYRRVFAAKYIRSEIIDHGPDIGLESHDLELAHPLLDYAAGDRAMADMLLKWDVLNADALTKEEQGILAYALSARPMPRSYQEYSADQMALFGESFTLALSRYELGYNENGDTYVNTYGLDGSFSGVCYSREGGYLYIPV